MNTEEPKINTDIKKENKIKKDKKKTEEEKKKLEEEKKSQNKIDFSEKKNNPEKKMNTEINKKKEVVEDKKINENKKNKIENNLENNNNLKMNSEEVICEISKQITMKYFNSLDKKLKNKYMKEDYEVVDKIKKKNYIKNKKIDEDREDSKYYITDFEDYKKYIMKNKLDNLLEWAFEVDSGFNEFELEELEIKTKSSSTTGKSYKVGDRKMEVGGEGCNFRMKDGKICGGKTTKNNCICARHTNLLFSDITDRGIYPYCIEITEEGKKLTTNNKNTSKKVELKTKEFMLPEIFLNNMNEYSEGDEVEDDIAENIKSYPLVWALLVKGYFDDTDKYDLSTRQDNYKKYFGLNKEELIKIVREYYIF